MKQFYIYVHCRPDGEPFYVGKGSGRRAYNLNRKHNPHHNNVVAKYGKENILIYIRNCESEQQAFKHERWMKAWCDAQGHRLTNFTDGGEGISGYKHTEETRHKMRNNHRASGYRPTPEFRAALSERTKGNKYALGNTFRHTPEAVLKISLKSKALWNTPEGKAFASIRAKAGWTPERHAAHSKRMYELWTPERRAAQSERSKNSKTLFQKGYTQTFVNKRCTGLTWINNGTINKRIQGSIPSGWVVGRLRKIS